jgi:uroporphyrinogen III methyltransferase/synthase
MLTLGEYEWLVFTSPNGVTAFFDYLLRGFEDIRALGNVRLAAVGPATAAKLREHHLRVDVMPEEYVARKVAGALAAYESLENLKICLLRAETANPDLPQALTELGAIVDDIAVYRTVPETEDRNGAAARLLEEGADWITFTSSSTVDHFHARFDLPKLVAQFPQLRLASIGPETSKSITALGLKPHVEAATHTIDGLVQSLLADRKAGAPRPQVK